jgi:pyruvate-formate lyase-activating enzyme
LFGGKSDDQPENTGFRAWKMMMHAKKNLLTAVVANSSGQIFELKGYAAVGMAGSNLVPLTSNLTVPIPYGSELMLLPDRRPILFNIDHGKFETLDENPYTPGEPIYPVAAFNSPGYVISYVSAYRENSEAGYLPLFSYGAVGWQRGSFRSAVIRVDRERRQDLRLMKTEKVIAGIRRMRKRLPHNRLRLHLEKCAMEYGCPAGKNFFLQRYEAPLPTAVKCNARCLGCLSLQHNSSIPCSQDRIRFTPSPEEIAAVALEHIRTVKQSVVSFGQGCEGDPLLAAHVIEPAIRLIRAETRRGTINMNTNGSRPDILKRLFDAGLDSTRISVNSVRKECYEAYFRPKDFGWGDVEKSFDLAKRCEKFIAINYLNCPGFSDTPEEFNSLMTFIRKHPLDLIQWRNLNYDPLRYWELMNRITKHGPPLGMQNILNRIRKSFPDLKYGYFNPPKEKFK